MTSGSVVLLKGKGSVVTFSVASGIQFSLFSNHHSAIITSDGFDCTVTKITFQNSSVESHKDCRIKGQYNLFYCIGFKCTFNFSLFLS